MADQTQPADQRIRGGKDASGPGNKGGLGTSPSEQIGKLTPAEEALALFLRIREELRGPDENDPDRNKKLWVIPGFAAIEK
jgi:hypothetical protein